MKRKFALVIFTAVLMLFASQAFALLFELTYDYYSDGTFTTWVGEEEYDYCNDIFYTTGSTSSWRVKDKMNCDTHTGIHECQQLVNGSWTNITCPPGV